MTKFEQELRRMFDHDAVFPNAKFVGNVCYGRLTDQIRVKIYFKTGMFADRYDRLKVTLLNRNEGVIDSMVLKFADLWGRKTVRNPNFREGIFSYIWCDGADVDWYVYQPTKTDYQQAASAVRTYLEVFQEPAEELQPGQKMC
jgi:hypothetical protein